MAIPLIQYVIRLPTIYLWNKLADITSNNVENFTGNKFNKNYWSSVLVYIIELYN
jgi:hypothetical protein